MVFCPRCGKQASETDQYCTSCGGPFSRSETSATQVQPSPPGGVPAAAAPERFFLQNSNGVSVSNLRFVVAKKVTYAMANVSSVSLKERPPKRTGRLLMLGVFLIWCVVAIQPPVSNSIYFAVAGLVASILSLAVQKTLFVVRVQGGGGESDALVSPDRAFVQQVVTALEQAIIARG